MNFRKRRDSILAVIGLISLMAYVIACTAFSPDGKKVLYPAYDPDSGALGVWVYDRPSAQGEPVFTPRVCELGNRTAESILLRPLWTPDGRHMVVAWPGDPDGAHGSMDGLNLAVIPTDRRGSVRLFQFPELRDTLSQLLYRVAACGPYLFFSGETKDTNVLLRLEVSSGEVRRQAIPEAVVLFPGGRGDQLHYVRSMEPDESRFEFGRIDPEMLTFEARGEFLREKGDDDGCLAVSADGEMIAFLQQEDRQAELVLYRPGQPEQRLPLSTEREFECIGNLVIAPQTDRAYAVGFGSCRGETEKRCDLIEIPLDGTAARFIPLFVPTASLENSDLLCLQVGLSPDGQAAALASTYLTTDDAKVSPDDCALFLVNLADQERSVTRVPIALPQTQDP